MRDCWYVSGPDGQVGPIALEQLKQTLATHPHAKDMFIWHETFPEWIRAGDLAEIVAQAAIATPPAASKSDASEPATDTAPTTRNSLSLENFHPDREFALTLPPPNSDGDTADAATNSRRRWTASALMTGTGALILG